MAWGDTIFFTVHIFRLHADWTHLQCELLRLFPLLSFHWRRSKLVSRFYFHCRYERYLITWTFFRHQSFGQQNLARFKKVVPKTVHTPLPLPPPTWRAPLFLSYPTPTPEISVILQIGWVPPGKNIYVKNAVALYCYAKDNCFCDKERNYFFYFC